MTCIGKGVGCVCVGGGGGGRGGARERERGIMNAFLLQGSYSIFIQRPSYNLK